MMVSGCWRSQKDENIGCFIHTSDQKAVAGTFSSVMLMPDAETMS